MEFNVIKPLSANFTKWSNTLKQFFGKLPTNCLSLFDHLVGLALKGLILRNSLWTWPEGNMNTIPLFFSVFRFTGIVMLQFSIRYLVAKSNNSFKYFTFRSSLRFPTNDCFLFRVRLCWCSGLGTFYSFHMNSYSLQMYWYWHFDGSLVFRSINVLMVVTLRRSFY